MKNLRVALQPAPAWIAIIGLSLFLTLCFLIGAGRVLIPIFPAGSLFVGIFLYFRAPNLYVGFTLWIWFLGPLIRRIIDYQSGYVTPGSVIFTPIVVTPISAITLIRHFPKSYKQGGLPFILSLGSVFYGTLIGLVQNPIKDNLMLTLPLTWSCPILFGFHLFVNWRDYPIYQKTIQRAFLWGLFAIGTYGTWQFLVAPDWERFWLLNSGRVSFGIPEPLGIRTWGTMSSPQEFATAVMTGLLLLLSGSGSFLRFPAAGFGVLTFLLSRARAVWLSGVVGLLVYILSLKPHLQMRAFVTVAIATALVVPLVFVEPFYTNISNRIESISISGIEDDPSLRARTSGYNLLLNQALSEVVGKGLGYEVNLENTNYNLDDGAILPLFFFFGWLGVIPYMSGLLLLLFKLLQGKEKRFDTFNSAASAITLGIFSQIGFNIILLNSTSVFLWGFLSMGLAGRKYYLHQDFVLGRKLQR